VPPAPLEMTILNRNQAPLPIACLLILLALGQVSNLAWWSTRLAAAAVPVVEAKASPLPAHAVQPRDHPSTAFSNEDLLWLARCIYSETKRADEQELVAWVVRNRVETGYRGKRTYREVVLEPFQFSAFNPDNPKRGQYGSLDEHSTARGWQRALRVAHAVLTADYCDRPFSEKTRHFYSPRSMVDGQAPLWADQGEPLEIADVDPERFRFFASVV